MVDLEPFSQTPGGPAFADLLENKKRSEGFLNVSRYISYCDFKVSRSQQPGRYRTIPA